jgi:hypothetical protein
VIGLFAVVAIESSSQRLGRTYAVLLFFAVVLDVAWFILFSHAIWYVFGSHHLSAYLPQFFFIWYIVNLAPRNGCDNLYTCMLLID